MTDLSLSVQYAVDAPDLPRWRLRGWVKRAIAGARTHLENQLDIEQVVLTIRLIDEVEARELNRTFRGRDYATNVLTFNFDPAPGTETIFQADIAICEAVLRQEATQQHKPVLDHAAHLCIHATLHALGFEHETDDQAQEMESLETEILAGMGIADPYQVRN
ncbi:rRNA maturation RNase YbeY [Orrella marina]|uniref:Endoribonuclease YbeY n=1 Tax=Orrella marina TaxID=2163011 RepID=A0A2R4XIQ9_9BURK|nr:rRNA maturation RNase YbeY [Orrella marina]AWB33690.1 rRNA maturation RNase YbeY [Orrella marina]